MEQPTLRFVTKCVSYWILHTFCLKFWMRSGTWQTALPRNGMLPSGECRLKPLTNVTIAVSIWILYTYRTGTQQFSKAHPKAASIRDWAVQAGLGVVV